MQCNGIRPHRQNAILFPLQPLPYLTKGDSTGLKGGSHIMSDEWWAYTKLDKDYKHSVVKHKRKEYVRGDVYTNTIEGAWSHLKRSMMGTYHRPSKEHLSKYCAEFEFTYNTRKKTPLAKFNQIIDKNLIRVGYTDIVGT